MRIADKKVNNRRQGMMFRMRYAWYVETGDFGRMQVARRFGRGAL